MYIGVAFRLRIIVEAPVVAPYLISESRAFVLYYCSVGVLCPILGSYKTQILCRTVVRLILKQFDYLIDIGCIDLSVAYVCCTELICECERASVCLSVGRIVYFIDLVSRLGKLPVACSAGLSEQMILVKILIYLHLISRYIKLLEFSCRISVLVLDFLGYMIVNNNFYCILICCVFSVIDSIRFFRINKGISCGA